MTSKSAFWRIFGFAGYCIFLVPPINFRRRITKFVLCKFLSLTKRFSIPGLARLRILGLFAALFILTGCSYTPGDSVAVNPMNYIFPGIVGIAKSANIWVQDINQAASAMVPAFSIVNYPVLYSINSQITKVGFIVGLLYILFSVFNYIGAKSINVPARIRLLLFGFLFIFGASTVSLSIGSLLHGGNQNFSLSGGEPASQSGSLIEALSISGGVPLASQDADVGSRLVDCENQDQLKAIYENNGYWAKYALCVDGNGSIPSGVIGYIKKTEAQNSGAVTYSIDPSQSWYCEQANPMARSILNVSSNHILFDYGDNDSRAVKQEKIRQAALKAETDRALFANGCLSLGAWYKGALGDGTWDRYYVEKKYRTNGQTVKYEVMNLAKLMSPQDLTLLAINYIQSKYNAPILYDLADQSGNISDRAIGWDSCISRKGNMGTYCDVNAINLLSWSDGNGAGVTDSLSRYVSSLFTKVATVGIVDNTARGCYDDYRLGGKECIYPILRTAYPWDGDIFLGSLAMFIGSAMLLILGVTHSIILHLGVWVVPFLIPISSLIGILILSYAADYDKWLSGYIRIFMVGHFMIVASVIGDNLLTASPAMSYLAATHPVFPLGIKIVLLVFTAYILDRAIFKRLSAYIVDRVVTNAEEGGTLFDIVNHFNEALTPTARISGNGKPNSGPKAGRDGSENPGRGPRGTEPMSNISSAQQHTDAGRLLRAKQNSDDSAAKLIHKTVAVKPEQIILNDVFAKAVREKFKDKEVISEENIQEIASNTGLSTRGEIREQMAELGYSSGANNRDWELRDYQEQKRIEQYAESMLSGLTADSTHSEIANILQLAKKSGVDGQVILNEIHKRGFVKDQMTDEWVHKSVMEDAGSFVHSLLKDTGKAVLDVGDLDTIRERAEANNLEFENAKDFMKHLENAGVVAVGDKFVPIGDLAQQQIESNTLALDESAVLGLLTTAGVFDEIELKKKIKASGDVNLYKKAVASAVAKNSGYMDLGGKYFASSGYRDVEHLVGSIRSAKLKQIEGMDIDMIALKSRFSKNDMHAAMEKAGYDYSGTAWVDRGSVAKELRREKGALDRLAEIGFKTRHGTVAGVTSKVAGVVLGGVADVVSGRAPEKVKSFVSEKADEVNELADQIAAAPGKAVKAAHRATVEFLDDTAKSLLTKKEKSYPDERVPSNGRITEIFDRVRYGKVGRSVKSAADSVVDSEITKKITEEAERAIDDLRERIGIKKKK